MNQPYEMLYIIPGSKTEEEAKQVAERIQQLLRDQGATISKQDFWGKRRLAYEIRRARQGFYDYLEFDLDSQALAPLERALGLNEDVLRYQVLRRIVKTPEQLAADQQLRERIAARRQAEKERHTAAAMATEAPPPTPSAPAPQVSGQELEKKLEEILEEEKVDV
ncbi:MAG: 30S ribosomal protein S6 [Candidatus Kerfeldbacteria bacterium]|nr:30S ribosomal protein S6 [Candidatus Kerfeldbacteria bacterium]